jgi:hypothetical protein
MRKKLAAALLCAGLLGGGVVGCIPENTAGIYHKDSKVTQENFAKIRVGDSFETVKKLLGDGYEEVMRVDQVDHVVVGLQWKANGHIVSVQFEATNYGGTTYMKVQSKLWV